MEKGATDNILNILKAVDSTWYWNKYKTCGQQIQWPKDRQTTIYKTLLKIEHHELH